jgi:peptidoglycan/xylan/chitin deacetylase (PgdA/CDA1 family)
MTPQLAGLMYHDIGDDPTASGFQRPGAHRYRLTPRAFAAQLDALAQGAAAPALVTTVDFGHPGRYVLLTFDDGGKSALYASEELQRRGWRAHFFLVTGLLGARTFLDADGVRELRSAGHVVGSHSHTHPDIFKDLTPDRMADEWRVSQDRLAQILGEPCIAASVPGGDIAPPVLESADAAGLRYLFTSEPWLQPRRVGSCWVLGRYGLKAGIDAARVSELARCRGWRRALLVRRLKGLLRSTFPQLYRQYVRHTTREEPAA